MPCAECALPQLLRLVMWLLLLLLLLLLPPLPYALKARESLASACSDEEGACPGGT